jgi:single-strand DNA-binding protein
VYPQNHPLRRLAADAELRFSGNGNPVTRVALAVNDRTGQVHYLDVIVFGEGAKVLGPHGTKGRGLVVTGRISTRTWEAQDGGRRKSVDLICEEFHFADRAPAAGSE